MTDDDRCQRERPARLAMIEEFQQARMRRQRTRRQTLGRKVDDGASEPIADAARRALQDFADLLDLIRWGSDKG
jgi:hypothetical protein